MALVGATLLVLRPAAAQTGAAPVLPDLVADRPEAPAIYHDGTAGGQTSLLLRFDGFVHNAGRGDLEVVGTRDGPDDPLTVRQLLYPAGRRGDGEHVAERALQGARLAWDSGDGHYHFHLDRVAGYSLWNAGRAAQVAPAMKVGFCLVDSRSADAYAAQRRWDLARELLCGQGHPGSLTVREGLSPGWRDWYRAGLAYQWVDISSVLPGSYWLRNDVDPEGFVHEADEVNPPAYAADATVVPGFNASPRTAVTDAGRPVAVTLSAQRWAGSTPDSQPGATRPAYAVVEAPGHGTLGPIAADGTVVYTPAAGYRGPDAFRVTASDPTSAFPRSPAIATVSLQVGAAAGMPQPAVAISGAPATMVAGTSVQLTATVVDDDADVTWSASAGTITPDGIYTAPSAPPAGGAVHVTAASSRASDRQTIQIVPVPPVVPRSDPSLPPAGTTSVPIPPAATPPGPALPHVDTHHRGRARPGARRNARRGVRRLSPIAAERIGRRVAISVTPAVSGTLRVSAHLAGRRLGGCAARVRAGRPFTCRLRLPRAISARAPIRVVAALRSGGRVTRVERRPAPVPAPHGH